MRKILVEASTTAGNRETITIRSRENSREDSKDLDTSADHNKSFNAPQKRSLSSPSLEPPSFRKPELPASHAQFRTAPKTAHAAKHPRSEDKRRPVSTERAPKRTRPKLTSRHTLDPESFHTAGAAAPRKFISPPSPLFFSHTPRHRPFLSPGFSSSEAAATMLNRARDEPGGVTTLKLARGSISNASPPRSSSRSESFASLDRYSAPRSPDVRSKDQSGREVLVNVGIIELLEQEERPTFIIDVANLTNFSPGPLNIVYANPSLRAYEAILEMITGKADLDSPGIAVTNDFPEFKAWALSFVKNGESLDICLPSFLYGGITWTCSTLRKRLRLISGNGHVISAAAGSAGSSNGALSSSSHTSERPRASRNHYARSPLAASLEASDYFGDAMPDQPFSSTGTSSPIELVESPGLSDETSVPPKQAMLASQSDILTSQMMMRRYSEASSFDWTRLPISAALPRHIKFARSIDWAATPLGPIESWTFDLRAMCNLIMGSPHPAAMYWGDDYTAIYNEAYVLLAGQKHPELMGQSYKVAWAEIWDEIEPVFTSARESGQATMKDDDCLFLRRNGFLEESYFSWSIVPLVGEDGSVVGLYNPAFEKTRRKIAERRMLTLREVGEKTAAAREVKGFWGQVIKGLEYNGK